MAKKEIVKTCSVSNCKKKYHAKGFCIYHYMQTPERKAQIKKYQQKPEVKAKARARQLSLKYKTKAKETRDKPENKAK